MKFKVSAANNELLIYGTIGEDWWSEQSVEARDVVDAIADMDGPLAVRINSQGGIMDDAIAISTALKRYPGEVIVSIDGVAQSAASFIAMAGDRIIMDASSVMMIHGPSTMVSGNAQDLEAAQAALETYTAAMLPAYTRGGTISEEVVTGWLDDGQDHFFSASQALEVGLIDEISSQLPVAAINLDGSRKHMPKPQTGDPVALDRERIKEIGEIYNLALVRGQLAPEEIWKAEHAAIEAGLSADAVRKQVLGLIGQGDGPAVRRGPGDSGATGRTHIQLLNDEHEHVAKGITDALQVRMGLDKEGEIQKRVRQSEYMGMSAHEMCRKTLEVNGVKVRGMNRNDIVGQALTLHPRGGYRVSADRGITHTPSDFPALMENALNKAVLRGWDEAPETWRRIARPGSIPDFKPAPRAGLGEYPTLPELPPSGEYTYATVSDRKEVLLLATYGSIIGLTRRVIVNDDLMQLGSIGMKQGRAASRTVGDIVYFVLTSNPIMLQTGQPLFSAAHKNIAATPGAPSIETLDEMQTLLALQTDTDQNAHSLQLPLSRVIVPYELRTKARVLLRSQYDPDNVGNSRADNPFQGEFEVVSDARLSQDSPTQWYGSTNPDNFDLIEVGFLEGNQEPFMETKDGWTVDGVEMKVRIDATAAPLDYRSIVRNAGA